MKKFVLVLLCTLIILFFAGFNYLLWDRDNKAEDIKTLEYTNVNKDSYINYLTAEKKRIETENENLLKQIDTLEGKVAALGKQVENAIEDNKKLETMLQESDGLVKLLLEQADKQLLAQKIIDYVDFINSKEYGKAYGIRYSHGLGYAKPPVLGEFSSHYESSIESITLENVEYTDEYAGLGNGMHAFSVELNIQLKEGAEEQGCEFVPGMNIRMFIIGFDERLKEWVIADIAQTGS